MTGKHTHLTGKIDNRFPFDSALMALSALDHFIFSFAEEFLPVAHARGKKRTFWWSLVHSINVLLDARLKLSGFSFINLLEENLLQAA